MMKFLPTFLAQLRPAILHFCHRTAAPGTSGNYRGATARTQVRYRGGAGQIMVTIGVSTHRSCADHFRPPQKYILNLQAMRHELRLFLVRLRFRHWSRARTLERTWSDRLPGRSLAADVGCVVEGF